MKPYYDDGKGIVIYHGDALEILPTLKPGDATGVVTDPPFGIGFNYGDYEDRPESYGVLMQAWIAEATRIVGNGPIFVWQAMLTASRWHEWFPVGFRILAACRGFVQFKPQPIQHSWDPVIFWGVIQGIPSVYRKDWHVQSLAPFGANRSRVKHPCPRPLEQVRYVLEMASTPIVLDPFMGSGTTLRAAKDLGRRAIGIEISEEYCRIAVERLQQGVLPL